MNKRTIFVSLLLASSCLSLASCNSGSSLTISYDDIEYSIIDDNYRNMYQIFPVAFADSDGNGKGDLQGIIDKLDYLQEMNYTGIWLNPIHPSSTYHHYDVEDYYDISSDFGDLETFDALVDEVHSRNMTIILDLVINHSSNQHEWFTDSYYTALNMYNNGVLEEKANTLWYNWVDATSGTPTGYNKVNSSDKIAYESRFDSSMPDFNLDPVINDTENSSLATEFQNIFKFWLIDHDVDGFRLDAITSYFTGDQNSNLAMLTWINDECKALKPNCYIVGEGSWGSNSSENQAYQASGIDSFFQFGNSAKNSGYPIRATTGQNAVAIYEGLVANRTNAAGGIESPFLGNHDVPRYIGSVSGRSNLNNAKFVMGLFQQLGGATFTYYGDEVGMASQSSTADGYYRLPIQWGDDYTCQVDKMKISGVSSSSIDESKSYPYASVANQLADSDSLLNYVKKANLIRLEFPEIARGDTELVDSSSDKTYAVIKRTYNGSSIYVIINASYSNTLTIDYSSFASKVCAELCVSGNVKREAKDSTSIVIPTQSIVICQ